MSFTLEESVPGTNKLGKWEGGEKDIITEHLSVLSAMPVRLAIRFLFPVALDGSAGARLEGHQCC